VQDADGGGGGDAIEVDAVLAVVVADDEGRCSAEGCGFAELLYDPFAGGVVGDADVDGGARR
jgi:hypothetical protein